MHARIEAKCLCPFVSIWLEANVAELYDVVLANRQACRLEVEEDDWPLELEFHCLIFYAHRHQQHQHLVFRVLVGGTNYTRTAWVGHFYFEHFAVKNACYLKQECAAEANADGVARVFAKDELLSSCRIFIVLTGQLDVVVAQFELNKSAALVAEDADTLQGTNQGLTVNAS